MQSMFPPQVFCISTFSCPSNCWVIVRMETDSLYCSNCGARLQPGSRFCSQCGQSVASGEAKGQPGTPLDRSAWRLRRRQWILRLIEKFREKGAVSPDKALAAPQLGLGPRFELAMHRRLGKEGIFVEMNGRYYLSEEKLKGFRDRMAT